MRKESAAVGESREADQIRRRISKWGVLAALARKLEGMTRLTEVDPIAGKFHEQPRVQGIRDHHELEGCLSTIAHKTIIVDAVSRSTTAKSDAMRNYFLA
ncbi:hypothetical protein [Cryobacterium sp. Y82]|uniref:hypothetical protein n=1 Tax=Cryobacterium sp. Y82 TaxID=2045017 RepID=UPI000CE2FD6B|nr:hypothetical protein [Cryobacterium sp. Y82]